MHAEEFVVHALGDLLGLVRVTGVDGLDQAVHGAFFHLAQFRLRKEPFLHSLSSSGVGSCAGYISDYKAKEEVERPLAMTSEKPGQLLPGALAIGEDARTSSHLIVTILILKWLPDWLPDRGSCFFSVSLGSCPGRPLLHGSLIACSCLSSALWCHTPRSHVRPLRTPEAAVLLFADPQKEVSTFILGPPTRCMATPD